MVIFAVVLMLVLGAILGLGLGVADKYLKVEADERVETVTGLLPGYNCGGCGFPGCSGMAEALVSKDMDHIACKPCKPDKRQEIIDYLKNTPGPDGSTIELKG
jgi:Na+-translocating ferredoxin:NAD+ oxidoreductase subunit B